jgi:hypothetical protein
MKITPKIIQFQPSASPDVVTNRLYFIEAPAAVDYDSPFIDVGNATNVDGKVEVNLGAVLPALDGVYNIGVAAVDDGGNEANMSLLSDFPLDLVAPDAVGPIEVL